MNFDNQRQPVEADSISVRELKGKSFIPHS